MFDRKQGKFDLFFKKGQELYRSGKYEDAVKAFNKALESGQNLVCYYSRGLALARLGDLEQAAKNFERVARSSGPPQLVLNAVLSMGKACKELGRYREALSWYDRALALNPKSSIVYCDRAVVRIQIASESSDLRGYERAIKDLDESIMLNPKDPLSYWNRAIAHSQLSEQDKALEDVKRFLSLAPPDHPYREDAEKLLENSTASPAGELDKRRRQELDNLVKQIIKKNTREKFEDALVDCDRAFNLAKKLPSTTNIIMETIFDEKAFALMGLGKSGEALECVERGLNLYPQSFRLWSTKGSIFKEQGRFREALGAFQKYVATAPLELKEEVNKTKEEMKQLRQMVEKEPSYTSAGVAINPRKIAQMQKILVESKDVEAARQVLAQIQEISHKSTRIGMLDYAATHCGIREIALAAFARLTEALQGYPPDVKAGQVEDMYFGGTRTSEIADKAILFTLALIESGELDSTLAPTQNFLNFVVQEKKGPMRERALKLLGG